MPQISRADPTDKTINKNEQLALMLFRFLLLLKNKAVIITGTAKAIKSLKLKVDKISISEIL